LDRKRIVGRRKRIFLLQEKILLAIMYRQRAHKSMGGTTMRLRPGGLFDGALSQPTKYSFQNILKNF
jgi:hypothetical protein